MTSRRRRLRSRGPYRRAPRGYRARPFGLKGRGGERFATALRGRPLTPGPNVYVARHRRAASRVPTTGRHKAPAAPPDERRGARLISRSPTTNKVSTVPGDFHLPRLQHGAVFDPSGMNVKSFESESGGLLAGMVSSKAHVRQASSLLVCRSIAQSRRAHLQPQATAMSSARRSDAPTVCCGASHGPGRSLRVELFVGRMAVDSRYWSFSAVAVSSAAPGYGARSALFSRGSHRSRSRPARRARRGARIRPGQ